MAFVGWFLITCTRVPAKIVDQFESRKYPKSAEDLKEEKPAAPADEYL